MTEIVSFPRRNLQIWVCNCGCSTFSLRSDGQVECANCEVVSADDHGGWLAAIKDGPGRADDAGEPIRSVQGNGREEFARRRVESIAAKPDVAVLIVIRKNSQIHTWADIETPEQVAWVRRRVRDAVKLIADFMGAAHDRAR